MTETEAKGVEATEKKAKEVGVTETKTKEVEVAQKKEEVGAVQKKGMEGEQVVKKGETTGEHEKLEARCVPPFRQNIILTSIAGENRPKRATRV